MLPRAALGDRPDRPGSQVGLNKCVTCRDLSTLRSYLVDVLDMVDLGTLGGETYVECGVFLAVEREKSRGRGGEDSNAEEPRGPGPGEL